MIYLTGVWLWRENLVIGPWLSQKWSQFTGETRSTKIDQVELPYPLVNLAEIARTDDFP